MGQFRQGNSEFAAGTRRAACIDMASMCNGDGAHQAEAKTTAASRAAFVTSELPVEYFQQVLL